MIESTFNDLVFGFVILMSLLSAAVTFVIVLVVQVARHCHRDFKKQGGTKGYVPKAAGKLAARWVGNALRKRLLG